MPAIAVSVQQTHQFTSLSLVPLDQAEFLLTLAAALVGPIALLALAVFFSRKYKTSRHPTLATVRTVATAREWFDLPKQSREPNAGNAIMSVNRKSESSPYRDQGTFDGEGLGSGRDLSQSPSSRQKHQKELSALKTDPDEFRNLETQPPLSMPLTPPALSTTSFSLQDRRPSVAASTNGDFDPTLAHGTTLDIGSTPSTASMLPNVKASSPISLRKSHTKVLPLDPLQSSSSIEMEIEDTSSPFAPSSFPSSSPILPLAPHTALDSREIDVAGEIVSVMDDSGAGWKRHTRVYGGGVCLACMASGDSHGGFYGENVPLDQRR
ncbi:hypothetical protein O1611_g2961 [Lasiodiplodia mahajangana]|uniref:Uncharacterized protein n=1 Tax=Lasiodiplodia mahajangana TaxID=1108764 RepID=A0ACC2JTJ9_9PEZI|nr:hypothetical protein O1611_g2961 [Lasiodiplodia mahajangana]